MTRFRQTEIWNKQQPGWTLKIYKYFDVVLLAESIFSKCFRSALNMSILYGIPKLHFTNELFCICSWGAASKKESFNFGEC